MPATLLAERPAKIATPEVVLAAGRKAFLAKRNVLDDLREYFASDLDEFLSAIFESMSAAARLEVMA